MRISLELKVLVVLFVLFFSLHLTNDYIYIEEDSNVTVFEAYVETDKQSDYIVEQIHKKNSSNYIEVENIGSLNELVDKDEADKKIKAFEDSYVVIE